MTEELLYYLTGINILTFLVYGIDKWKARKNRWRISEATLLILAIIGGSIGALVNERVILLTLIILPPMPTIRNEADWWVICHS